jgi:hypothetical protein
MRSEPQQTGGFPSFGHQAESLKPRQREKSAFSSKCLGCCHFGTRRLQSHFYIGGNGGWGQSHNCVDLLDTTGVAFAQGCRDRSGGLIGGQIGYRWQVNQWVFGLEGQGDWADLSNTRLSLIDPTFSTRTKTSGIGLFTGQIGYAWNASLLYVKGGAARNEQPLQRS